MKLLNLKTLFMIVAIVEIFYGIAGLFIPPSMTYTILGWNLSPDGQWVTKLLGLSLAIQAGIAWELRNNPPIRIAWLLAIYQICASTVDCTMWWLLGDQGIFDNQMAKISVIMAIPTHFIIGILLIIGIRKEEKQNG